MKRRVKQPHKDRNEKAEITQNVEREELDFQFDEEFDDPPPPRHNAFSEWLASASKPFKYCPTWY